MKKFKECVINNCQCWDCGSYRIVKQKDKDVYNAYKGVEPKPGKPIAQYSSVVKEIIRVEKYIDEETGEPKETNVLGPKKYSTLEEAMAACEQQ